MSETITITLDARTARGLLTALNKANAEEVRVKAGDRKKKEPAPKFGYIKFKPSYFGCDDHYGIIPGKVYRLDNGPDLMPIGPGRRNIYFFDDVKDDFIRCDKNGNPV